MDEVDRKLVLDARVGMREAFAKLVDRYRGRVYALAVSIMNDHAGALELTRDTFLRAHRELPKLQDADRFPGWLARLTYQVGREKRHDRLEDSEAELTMERSGGVPLDKLEAAGSGATIATPFAKGEAELALLDALVAALPERVRVALDLRFREGLSYGEIAETLEVQRGAVPTLLARGARKLRGKLKPFLRKGQKGEAREAKTAACEQAEPLLVPLLDGELGAEERGAVEAHVASCGRCVEAREDVRALHDLLRRHFAARVESIVTANVLRALDGEVTEALIRHENEVPRERAEAMTEPGAGGRPPAARSAPTRPLIQDEQKRLLGVVLGGYRIDGEIARGGMGTVYRATQLSMQRTVALKVLSRKFAVDETFVKRFVREARASANIEHPNVIKVYDAGEDKGDTFFAMELVEGDDAETLVIRDGAFEPRRAAEVALGVARALEAAHARGVVHRDVKPANVLVVRSTGAVKLADLGLAKLDDAQAGKDGHLTLRRVVMGSPNYMPPEQARDARDTDARSDVYSLGATLYHLATGERPYGGGTAVEIVARVVDPAPLAIPEKSKSGAALDPGIRAIIARACHKDRAKRYPSAAALREDIELYLGSKGTQGESVPARGRSQRSKLASKTTGAQRKLASRRSSSEQPALAIEGAWRRLIVPAATVLLGLLAAALLLRKPAVPPEQGTGGDVATNGSATGTTNPPKPPVSKGDPAAVATPAVVRTAADIAADKIAYQDLVNEGDRLTKLDRLGETATLYDVFLHDHASSSQAEKVRRELGDLRRKIATRAQNDLARAESLLAKNDFEGAEDILTGVDVYGDEPARAKAHVAHDALRARVLSQPMEKPPVQKPDDPPPPPPSTPPPAAPPTPTPVEKPPDDASLLARVDLAKFLSGKVEPLPGGRTRLVYDWSAVTQLEDWPARPREPSWLAEAMDSLPQTASPHPYDKARAWSVVKGAVFTQGFERHSTRAIFATGPLKIDIAARLLVGKNLIVTLGDPARPFVIAIGGAAPDASIPAKPGRPKEQLDTLARLQKKWKATFARPAIVVARELDAFDWEPTGLSSNFHPDTTRGTHVVIEARRDEDGDSLVVTADAQTTKTALGKDAFTAGPVGIESFGRAVVIESVTIEGSADPAWLKTLGK